MCRCEDRPCCGCHLEEAGDIESDRERYFERDDEDFIPDDEPEDDDPWDGFRSDAEADQDALDSVYGRDDDGSFYDDYDGCPGLDQWE